MFENDYYENEDFSNCIISITDLSRKKFVKCKFRSTDFTDLETIFNSTFESCDFFSARLNGVHLLDSTFLSCNFKYANFYGTMFDECKMTKSDFTESDSLSIIIGGDWSYTVLRYLDFTKLKFDGTIFAGADLTGCRFNRCKIKYCNFNDSIMSETNFYASDIRGSSFENVDFTGINLKNAKVDREICITIAESIMEVHYFGEPDTQEE